MGGGERMYLTIKQQVKNLSKTDYRNLQSELQDVEFEYGTTNDARGRRHVSSVHRVATVGQAETL